MKTCCGKEVVTAFCPDCGRPIGGDALAEITSYIQRALSQSRAATERSRAWEDAYPDKVTGQKHTEAMSATERRIAKFERWLVYLKGLETKS